MKHGGVREGAGRPKTIKGDGEHVIVAVRLSKALYRKLMDMNSGESVGQTVRDCIRCCHESHGPRKDS